MTVKCENCRFFLELEEIKQERGHCRRFPAHILPLQQGNYVTVFPIMMNEGWCGEHQPSPVRKHN